MLGRVAVLLAVAVVASLAADGADAAERPNIVLFLTDDQDWTLGGWTPLTQAQKLLTEQGSHGRNWFIHTPVCCPSRAELTSGRYFHNIREPTPKGGCMHVANGPDFDSQLFAPHLQSAGYTVGLFGKYLNTGVPLKAPAGFDKWFANGGGTYYNPEFNADGKAVKFDNSSYAGYSTSIIGNVSLAWMKQAMADGSKPFMAYIGVKAPHIEDGQGFPKAEPAPWYADAFPGLRAPRTPNWNFSAADHHWLIAQQPPMTAQQALESDDLFRSRWQALLSVDDLVHDVVQAVDAAGQLNNTYFLFTSDHGFRLGQFRMPEGKWNVYENDIHIPFVIRGPGIAANSTFDFIGSNVDVMPTVLGLAGVPTPPTMDGRSLAALLVDPSEPSVPEATRRLVEHEQQRVSAENWRQELLITYYNLGNVVRYEHLEDTDNNTFIGLRIAGSASQHPALYAEFTTNDNWDYKKPADFFEYYDLATDPFQLHNAYNTLSAAEKSDLHNRLITLYNCRGATCN